MAQQQKNFDSTHNWKGDIEGVLRKFAGTKAAKLGLFRRIKVAHNTRGRGAARWPGARRRCLFRDKPSRPKPWCWVGSNSLTSQSHELKKWLFLVPAYSRTQRQSRLSWNRKDLFLLVTSTASHKQGVASLRGCCMVLKKCDHPAC